MNQQESKKYLDKSPSVFSMYIDKNLKSYIIPYINSFNILKVKKKYCKVYVKITHKLFEKVKLARIWACLNGFLQFSIETYLKVCQLILLE